MIGIYRIFHKETQRSYIGQSVNILNRIFTHFHSQTIRESKSLLATAMHDSDKSDFDWEILEICSKENLDFRECIWIDALNPIYPRGFNLRSGGVNGRMARKEWEDALYASMQMSLF